MSLWLISIEECFEENEEDHFYSTGSSIFTDETKALNCLVNYLMNKREMYDLSIKKCKDIFTSEKTIIYWDDSYTQQISIKLIKPNPDILEEVKYECRAISIYDDTSELDIKGEDVFDADNIDEIKEILSKIPYALECKKDGKILFEKCIDEKNIIFARQLLEVIKEDKETSDEYINYAKLNGYSL